MKADQSICTSSSSKPAQADGNALEVGQVQAPAQQAHARGPARPREGVPAEAAAMRQGQTRHSTAK